MALPAILLVCAILFVAIPNRIHAANNTFAAGMIPDPSFNSDLDAYAHAISKASNTGAVDTRFVVIWSSPDAHRLGRTLAVAPDPGNASDPYAYAWRTELTTVPSPNATDTGLPIMFHHLVFSEASVERMHANARGLQVFHIAYTAPNLMQSTYDECGAAIGEQCVYDLTQTLLTYNVRDNESQSINQSAVPAGCASTLGPIWLDQARTVDVTEVFVDDFPIYFSRPAYEGQYFEFLPGSAAQNNFSERAAMFYTTRGLAASGDAANFNTLLNQTIIMGVTEYNTHNPAGNDSWTSLTCHRVLGKAMQPAAPAATLTTSATATLAATSAAAATNAAAAAATTTTAAAVAAVRPAVTSVVALTLVALFAISC